MIKPTAYLHFTLPPDEYAPQDAQLLKRTYAYVAPTEATPGEKATIDMLVRVGGLPYLDASVPEEQERWNDIVAPWLATKLKKIEDTLDACNNEEARSFVRHFTFEEINIFLEDRIFTFRMEEDGFPAIIETIEAIRKELAEHPEQYDSATRFLSPAGSLSQEPSADPVETQRNYPHYLKHERNRFKKRAFYNSIDVLTTSGSFKTALQFSS